MSESYENGPFQSLISSAGMHVIKRLMLNYETPRQYLFLHYILAAFPVFVLLLMTFVACEVSDAYVVCMCMCLC